MNIVSIFHNDEINKHGAQLIFNTHNPIYLNNRLLRRDEIKFVEKDDNGSSIYALSDFKTNGEISVRKTTDYMKNYFVNRYGAILDIDFSDIIDDIINGENEDGKR
jgi:AAA15 family ATPase/GTPase